MPVTEIHKKMRRVLLNDAGHVEAYLDENHSGLLDGTDWHSAQKCAAGTAGLTLKGSFAAVKIGTIVHNETKDFDAIVLAKPDNNTLTVHYSMQTIGTNWETTTDEGTNKLYNEGASFVADVAEGMIACKRDLSDYAVITNVDDDEILTLDKDIFSTGAKYSILQAFEMDDDIKFGTAVLDGTAGQVMVEIPLFYFHYEPAGGSGHNWSISEKPGLGLVPHIAFVRKDGSLRKAIYVSAFEGAVNDRLFNSPKLTDKNLTTAKLASLPGLTPLTYGQRSEFRQVVMNRGEGWYQWDHATNWALQLLFMIEHETLHSQSKFIGLTNWASATVEDFATTFADNISVQQTGYSLREGNTSKMNGAGNNGSQYFTWRGIENFYGHLYKWVEGISINAYNIYLSFNPEDYADDTDENFINTGLITPDANGYINAIHESQLGLLPKTASGSSTTYLCDQFLINSADWRCVRSGGYSYYGTSAGFAMLTANSASSTRLSLGGSRVCYR